MSTGTGRARLHWLLVAWCAACAAPVDEDDGTRAIAAVSGELAGVKSYVVLYADGVDVDAATDELTRAHGLGVSFRYRSAVRGAALLVPNDAARDALEADARVLQVELDQPISAIARPRTVVEQPPEQVPTGWRLIGAGETTNEGRGLRVAVLDTGADLTHPDLAANLDLSLARDCVGEGGAAYQDGNGHGTHVSGTIAAADNDLGALGVGTAIRVVPVKVLNKRGSGSWSSIICGVDHVTAHASEIRVANMSLGGPGGACSGSGCTKSALQLAIERSVAAGVTYAVAAGNEAADASTSVPAAYPVVITVSAYRDTDGVLSADDGWASFTNYGSGVDLAAPGYRILSTWTAGGYSTISGTSMASPHVAAAAALFVANHPTATPAQVRDGLRALARTTYPGSTDSRHEEPLLDVRGL